MHDAFFFFLQIYLFYSLTSITIENKYIGYRGMQSLEHNGWQQATQVMKQRIEMPHFTVK